MADFKSTLYVLIGNRIRDKREKLGIRQEQLAEKVLISRASISNIENGRHQVPLSILYIIAEFLHIGIHELLPSFQEVTLEANKEIKEINDILSGHNISPDLRKAIQDIIENPSEDDNIIH